MLRFMLKKALQSYEEKIGAAIEAHRWLYRCKLTPNQVISARLRASCEAPEQACVPLMMLEKFQFGLSKPHVQARRRSQ